MMIINAFACDANGKVANGESAKIIMIKKGENSSRLDKTMSKKKLTAGNYIMNIVAAGKTARVFFVVK